MVSLLVVESASRQLLIAGVLPECFAWQRSVAAHRVLSLITEKIGVSEWAGFQVKSDR